MLTYNPKLDVLRAFAVSGVIVSHWINSHLGHESLSYLYFGCHGVEVFFCLSGFLITYILLKSKYSIPAQSLSSILKTFFIRRTLRIFPIYYLFIFTLFIAFGNYVFFGDFLYFVFYLSNINNFINQTWGSRLVNHLWSLAVEEQFYLIWPFLILLTPRKREIYVISSLLVTGIIFYYLLTYSGYDLVNILTFVNFDFLCTGAFLAYVHFFSVMKQKTNIKYVLVVIFISVLSAFFNLGGLQRIWLLLFSASLIFCLSFYENKPMLNLWSPFIYIGKISYGLYIYHKPIPFITDLILSKIGVNMTYYSDSFRFIIYLFVLFIISSLSWFIIEKRILSIKERYNYSDKNNAKSLGYHTNLQSS